MRNLLITIAAVAFLAAPAMAVDVDSPPIEVQLEILGYIAMQNFTFDPSPTITLTPDPTVAGAESGSVKITGELYSNFATLSATAAVTGAGVGTWGTSWLNVPGAAVIDYSPTAPKHWIATWVDVTVPFSQAPQAATLGATVTFTVSGL